MVSKEKKLAIITSSPSSGNVRNILEEEDKEQVSPGPTRSPARSPNTSPLKVKSRSRSLEERSPIKGLRTSKISGGDTLEMR